MKNSSDTIGNRTRDFPTCSAGPQPTALRRTPTLYVVAKTANITTEGNELQVQNTGLLLMAVQIIKQEEFLRCVIP